MGNTPATQAQNSRRQDHRSSIQLPSAGYNPPVTLPSLDHIPAVVNIKYAMPSSLIRFIDVGRLIVPYNWGGGRWFTLNENKKNGYFSTITQHQSGEIGLAEGLEHFAIHNDVLYVAGRKNLYKINAPIGAEFAKTDLMATKILNEGRPLGVHVFGDNFIYHYERALFTRNLLIRGHVQLCDVSKKYGNVVLYAEESKMPLAKSHSIFWYSSIAELETVFSVSPQRYWVGAPLIALKIHKNTIAYAYDLKHIHILNVALMTIEIITLTDCEFNSFIINDVSQSFDPVGDYSFKQLYRTNDGHPDCIIVLITKNQLFAYILNKDNKIIGRYSLTEKYNNLYDIDGGFIGTLEGENFGHLAFYDLFSEKSTDARYLPVI